METVLITAIGSFSASSVINSLKENEYRVIGCDIHDSRYLECSIDVERCYKVPLGSQVEEYIECLLKICKDENVRYLIPLTDYEIDTLNANRDIFKQNSIVLCLSSKETIDICRDKYKSFDYLKNNGVSCIIDSFPLDKVNISDCKYPLVIKPVGGRSSQGLHCFKNKSELKHFIDTEENISEYIIQPYITGNVVTVDVCRQNDVNEVGCGECIVSLAREELIRTLNGAGTSVRIFKDKKLDEYVYHIASLLNVVGTVCFEFIKAEEDYYFLECNPRFSGGVAFSYAAGYDFVKNSINCFSGKKIEKARDIKEQYIVKKYVEVVTYIVD